MVFKNVDTFEHRNKKENIKNLKDGERKNRVIMDDFLSDRVTEYNTHFNIRRKWPMFYNWSVFK